MRAVEIHPSQMCGPANDRRSCERAQTGDDANSEGKSQEDGGGHRENLSRKGRKNEAGRGGRRAGESCGKKEGARLGIQGPKGRAPVIRPRRDRIMGSSIQLPSQRQVGATHTILQVGPFLPTYGMMRIVLERDPRRTYCK